MKKISYRTFSRGPFWLIPTAVGLVVLLMPFYVADAGVLRTTISIALLSMLVVGLNVPFGFAGELALGQSAIYAVGAYFGGYFAVKGLDLPATLVVAILAAAAVGFLTGIPGLRLGSWSLGMVTFFFVLLIPDVVNILAPVTGGPGGLTGVPLPSIFGAQLGSTGYFVTVIAVAMLFFALLRNYVTSRHGVALRVTKESPVLARSLGYSVPRLKLTAYLISALPAGAAGALFAYQDGYISPTSFGFQMAVAILAASILGGNDSIYGAVFGSAVLVIGPLQLAGTAQFSLILFGVLLVVGGLFFTGGIAGLLRAGIRKFIVGSELMADVVAERDAPNALANVAGGDLRVEGLEKAFGGNKVLKGVNLIARKGEITALIGPNGSGKTTMLNVVSGFYRADAGMITLGQTNIAGLNPHSVATAGVSRTFQTPLVPKRLTAAEVVASARFRRSRTTPLSAMLRLPSTRKAMKDDRAQAIRLMGLLGIVELADQPASELPLGTRRILEVARALAGDPLVVLLDEPASGLDATEVEALGEVLKRLKVAGATIVIVEHNFEMVMSIADSVNVLHLGKMIASGSPEEVRRNPDVIESYLGKAARDKLAAREKGTAK